MELLGSVHVDLSTIIYVFTENVKGNATGAPIFHFFTENENNENYKKTYITNDSVHEGL